jgi:hypothetical protein
MTDNSFVEDKSHISFKRFVFCLEALFRCFSCILLKITILPRNADKH